VSTGILPLPYTPVTGKLAPFPIGGFPELMEGKKNGCQNPIRERYCEDQILQGDKMLVVVAVMKAKEGCEQEMENALRDMIPQVETEEGTLTYTLHRARKVPGKFLMYEKYRDKAAFNHHSSTPYFAELFGKIAPLLDGDPVIDIYEELCGIRQK
jgi:quinol monooxygenase YgiN